VNLEKRKVVAMDQGPLAGEIGPGHIRAKLSAESRSARGRTEEAHMGSNIFYIIGVVVVVLIVLGYLGLR